MKRTLQFALLSAIAASSLALLPGCQNRGNTDTTNAALPASGTTVSDHAMVASKDTKWLSAPNPENAESGTIASGTRVIFENSAAPGDWQPARYNDRVVYVKASDFVPAVQK